MNKITVLYDGDCKLCRKSINTLTCLDWCNTLEYANYINEDVRTTIAPDVPFNELDKALHIKKPTGNYLNGFDAFRYITWRLPLLTIIAPLLYIPGVPCIGRSIYTRIAAKRKNCTHENCAL